MALCHQRTEYHKKRLLRDHYNKVHFSNIQHNISYLNFSFSAMMPSQQSYKLFCPLAHKDSWCIFKLQPYSTFTLTELFCIALKVKSLSCVRLFATPWDCTLSGSSLSPWNFIGKSTRVGCHFLLQGIFPTRGLNPGLPHCRQTLYHLSHQGSPISSLILLFNELLLNHDKFNATQQ